MLMNFILKNVLSPTLWLLLAFFLVPQSYGATSSPPTSLIIKYRELTSVGKKTGTLSPTIRTLATKFGLTNQTAIFKQHTRTALGKTTSDIFGFERIFTMNLPVGADLSAIITAFSAHHDIEYVQENHRYPLTTIPNDTQYHNQWAPAAIAAHAAWNITTGDATIVIGIIDTGIDYDHEDLKNNIWINEQEAHGIPGVDDDGNGFIDDIRGWDFVDAPGYGGIGDYLERDNDPDDTNGHGTHVAGIAGGQGNNQQGIAGMAWNCRLMPLRAGFSAGVGGGLLEDDDIAAAIVYAADNGAQIISMSFGDAFLSYLMRDAIRYAAEKGCVLVAAAGNSGSPVMAYPARFNETIAVGNIDSNGSLISSNHGENIDLVAPGTNIYSTVPSTIAYDYKTGTSMAAPLVSGVAALLLSQTPTLSPEVVRSILKESADDLGPSGHDMFYGAGRVNAYHALQMHEATTLQFHTPRAGKNYHTDITITYDAHGPHLASYHIEYGIGTNPLTWISLTPETFSQAFKATITWSIAYLRDTNYTVRLVGTETDGTTHQTYVPLSLNRIPPVIHSFSHGQRLREDTYHYAIIWETEKNTIGTVHYRKTDTETMWTQHTDNYLYTIHAIDLGALAPGDYDFFIRASNDAGLVCTSETTAFTMPPHGTTPTLPLSLMQNLPSGYLLSQTADFDHDGNPETVIMHHGNTSYGNVHIYERNTDTLIMSPSLLLQYTHLGATDSLDEFLPIALTDINSDGVPEILSTLVYAPFKSSFMATSRIPGTQPDTITHIFNGYCRAYTDSTNDLNQNNNHEVVLLSSNRESLLVYESDGYNSFITQSTIPHPHTGYTKWSTLITIGDLANTGSPLMCVADIQGNIFSIAQNTTTPIITSIDSTSFPNGVTLLKYAGDLDGDGQNELIAVGAIQVDYPYQDPDDYWKIVVYEYEATSLRPIWTDYIYNISSSAISSFDNGITIADIHNNNTPDIILSMHPGYYVYTSTGDNTYAPLFYHQLSQKTGHPFIGKGTLRGATILPTTTGMALYALPGGMPVVDYPLAFKAQALDTSRALLTWQPTTSEHYTIYRGASYDSLHLLTSGYTDTTFIDTGLTHNLPYWYFVASRDTIIPALAQQVIPNAPPAIDSITTTHDRYHVTLYFTEPLLASTIHPGCFIINHTLLPTSVNVSADAIVILGFNEPLRSDTTHSLHIKNIQDRSQTPCAAQTYALTIAQQETSPHIDSVRYIHSRSVQIYFSQPIQRDSLHTSYIRLQPHYQIASISADSSSDSTYTLMVSPHERIDLSSTSHTIYVDTVYYYNTQGVLSMATGLSGALISGKSYANLDELIVYPNPYKATSYSTEKIIFAHVPSKVHIQIFTATGQRVKTIESDYSNSFVIWELKNDAGKKVASGLYYYYISGYGLNTSSHSKMGKMTIIR